MFDVVAMLDQQFSNSAGSACGVFDALLGFGSADN